MKISILLPQANELPEAGIGAWNGPYLDLTVQPPELGATQFVILYFGNPRKLIQMGGYRNENDTTPCPQGAYCLQGQLYFILFILLVFQAE